MSQRDKDSVQQELLGDVKGSNNDLVPLSGALQVMKRQRDRDRADPVQQG